MSGSRRTCEICGIRERFSAHKLFFARFPSSEKVCKEWVKLVGKQDLVYLPIEKLHSLRFVCEKHFGKRDFTKTRTRLKKHAVPKHQLTMTPLTEEQMTGFPFHMAKSQMKDEPVASKRQSSLPSVATSGILKEHNYAEPVAPTSQSSLPFVDSRVPKEHNCAEPVASTSYSSLPSVARSEVQKEHYHAEPVASTSHSSLPSVARSEVQKENYHAEPVASTSHSSLPSVARSEVQKEHYHAEPVASTSHSSLPSVARSEVQKEYYHAELPLCQASSSIRGSSSVAPEHGPRENVQTKGTKRKLGDEIDATPRKRKLIKELRKTKCTLSSLKKSARLLESLSSPVLKEIVLSALKNQKRKPQGKRWSMKNKISALAIFKRSPKTYRYLQHVIPLPSKKTLQNLIKKIPMGPGINDAVLKHLKKTAESKNIQDKLCVLLYDEIALKPRLVYNENTDMVEGFVDTGLEGRTSEVANHALVFMVQGIRRKFKQPLSFYFVKGTVSSSKLAVLIKENIRAVENTGHKVLATVCDQGPTNVGGLKLLKQWSGGHENDHFFKVDDNVVNIMYDVPHLFKSIRNNFLNNGNMEMNGKKAKWEHILEVEKKNRAFLYLSKISETHVRPKYRAKMRVKYAAQVLSQTVSAILKLLARSKENEERSTEIEDTALIVEQLNKLFDYTNGPSGPDDVKKQIRENVSEKTNHKEVWEEFENKMNTVKFYNSKGILARNVRCIDGWKITLKSLRSIWNVVQNYGFKYLNLRQLNQDALENLFGIIRQHSPTDKHPTCSGFMAALKTSVVAGMTAPHGKGSNCEKDSQKLLTNFHDIIFGDSPDTEEQNLDSEKTNKLSSGPKIEESKETSGPKIEESKETLTAATICDEMLATITIEDFEDLEIESDLTSIDNQPLVYLSGYIAYITLKSQKTPCLDCKQSMTVNEHYDNAIYNVIALREWWKDKNSLTYPSINLCRSIEKAVNIFQTEVKTCLHRINICAWTTTVFYLHCDYNWVCEKHAKEITKIMFVKLALLLIRRECKIINESFSNKEEKIADTVKKAQQGVS